MKSDLRLYIVVPTSTHTRKGGYLSPSLYDFLDIAPRSCFRHSIGDLQTFYRWLSWRIRWFFYRCVWLLRL